MKEPTEQLNFEAQRLAFGFDPLNLRSRVLIDRAAGLHTLQTDFSVLRH
jgi:hypothetical protein